MILNSLQRVSSCICLKTKHRLSVTSLSPGVCVCVCDTNILLNVFLLLCFSGSKTRLSHKYHVTNCVLRSCCISFTEVLRFQMDFEICLINFGSGSSCCSSPGLKCVLVRPQRHLLVDYCEPSERSTCRAPAET